MSRLARALRLAAACLSGKNNRRVAALFSTISTSTREFKAHGQIQIRDEIIGPMAPRGVKIPDAAIQRSKTSLSCSSLLRHRSGCFPCYQASWPSVEENERPKRSGVRSSPIRVIEKLVFPALVRLARSGKPESASLP